FYAGAHAGVGWSDGDGSGSSGFSGGGQIGFDYQINQLVFGVEGDFAGTTLKDRVSATVARAGTVITGNADASLDWISTLAPRVGYACQWGDARHRGRICSVGQLDRQDRI